MTTIRQRLQQDLQAPGTNPLKQALGDLQMDPIEFQKLRQHYTGGVPTLQDEFDKQFADFMQVNFDVKKTPLLGANICHFPSKESVTLKRAQQGDRLLLAGKYWDFIKLRKEASPAAQAELLKVLNRRTNGLSVSNEQTYRLAKDILSSARSLLQPEVFRRLEQRTKAYEIFTGHGDSPVMDQSVIHRCESLAKAHRNSPDTPLIRVEKEVTFKTAMPHTAVRLNPGDEVELLSLLAKSSDPRLDQPETRLESLVGKARPGNQPSYTDLLTAKILAQPGKNLDPATVLKLALEATKGDYSLAVLAAHNLLKHMAYAARETSAHPNSSPAALSPDHLRVIEKLGSLRPAGSTSTDKLGPWYHFFGVQVLAAAYGSSQQAGLAVGAEHFIREDIARIYRGTVANWVANLFGGSVQPSPKDWEKAAVDESSLDLARRLFSNEGPRLGPSVNEPGKPPI